MIWETGGIRVLTHDRGGEFLGVNGSLDKKHGFEVRKSSAYHPEGNGMAEAAVKKLKSKFAMMLESISNFDKD